MASAGNRHLLGNVGAHHGDTSWRSKAEHTRAHAKHIRLEDAQKLSSHACLLSMRKEPSYGLSPGKRRSEAGNLQASQAGTSKHAQAEYWQAFSGRELAKRPRQGLQNVTRRGLGKLQEGICQASQAGTASVPRQGTGKHVKLA